MPKGQDVGSFFSGFGQAFGGQLLSYEKEKRARKHQDDMIAADVWTKILTDPKEPYERRRAAGQQLQKITGIKEIGQMADLFPTITDDAEPQIKQGKQGQGPASIPQMPAEAPQPTGGGPVPSESYDLPQMPTRPGAMSSSPVTSAATDGGGGMMPVQQPAMGPQAQEDPLFPSVTKGRPAQAPTSMTNIQPMPQRQFKSQWEEEQFFQQQQQQAMETFRTNENIRQATALEEMKRKAESGELGEQAGLIDMGNGEVGMVYVNPINSEKTVVKLGKPLNKITQELEALKASGIQLTPDEIKQTVLGIRPSGPEAMANQDRQDWIDSKNADPNVSGPAQLRLKERWAQLNATKALTLDRLMGLNKEPSAAAQDKQAQTLATKEAIGIFGGQYKTDYIQRQAQAHLQQLQAMGDSLQVVDPKYGELAGLLGQAKGNPQAMANLAVKMAEKDAADYYQRLIALKKNVDGGPQMVHIQEVRNAAAQAAKLGRDPNEIWNIYKRHHWGDIVIVNDDLQPWQGEDPAAGGPQQGVQVGGRAGQPYPSLGNKPLPLYK